MNWVTRMGTAAAVAAVSMAGSAFAQADLTGKWLIQADMGGQKIPGQMTVKKEEEGKYSGTISGPQGEMELSGITLEEGDISFTASLEMEDQQMEFKFSGGIDDEGVVTGTLVSEMGEIPVVGIRAGLPGTWKVTTESQLGTMERKLVVNEDMSAVYKGDSSEYDVENLKVSDSGEVTFDVTIEVQGQEMPLSFKGKVDGPKLTGDYMSDGSSVATLTGNKVFPQPADPGKLAGDWELEVDSPLGLLEHTMTVQDDGTVLYGQGDGEPAEIKDLEVDGEYYMFPVSISGYDVIFEGKVNEEGEIEGSYLLDGNPVASVIGWPAGGSEEDGGSESKGGNGDE